MKLLLGIVGLAVVLVGGALAWMGLFNPVSVTESSMGPYPFVYIQEQSTDFEKIGQITETLGARLQDAGYTKRRPAQVFYPPGRGIQNEIGFVTERAVTREVLGAETYFRPVPAEHCLVARFPFRNPLSFMVGHWRVDGLLRKHRTDKKYAETRVMVILEGSEIVYLQPIEPR